MTAGFDLVIRGGTVLDGSGGAPFVADIAVRGGVIAAVGDIHGQGHEEIDATGLIVTPGFVDIHTHYDGHATWSERLAPSSAHGVTTVVTGNCGVGFAPCRPADRAALVRLMEGVEDIPEPVITAGLPWNWETFPEYLDALERRRLDMDIATQVPHAPLRVYVMGQRGVDREPATPDDIARMAAIAREAVRAGALGFTTSRTINHRASDGSPTFSLTAGEDELAGIADALRAEGRGVLQLISDFDEPEAEFDMVERLARRSGRPLSLSLMQVHKAPDRWSYLLGRIEHASDAGLRVRGQVCGRPIGVLMGLELSYHPFTFCPGYAAIAHLPLAQRVTAMRDPDVRRRIVGAFPTITDVPISSSVAMLDRIFAMGERPDYEPDLADSLAARGEREGRAPAEIAYDALLARGGHGLLYLPAVNYADGTTAAAETMLRHKDTVLGLGDGGAHCSIICDASLPTYMLARWAGEGAGRIPLTQVIRALTAETAETVGLNDRGRIAPGYKADLNVIDLDRIALHLPHVEHDLPAGGGRVHQRADGFVATIVSGAITYREGVPTGALPGRLVRGAQDAPQPRKAAA